MPAPYFLYVNGSGRPRRPHYDLESARREAARLFRFATQKPILILETVETLTPPDIPGFPLPQHPAKTTASARPIIEVKRSRLK